MSRNTPSGPATSSDAASRHPSRRRILILVSLGLGFAAVEFLFRLAFAFLVGPSVLWHGPSLAYGWHPEPSRQVPYFKYAPRQRRYDHDPDTGERFRITINDHGFRGRDFPPYKRRGTVRVITLGASSTFGFTNRDTETYPRYMEELLNRRPSGTGYEVLNFGIPHLRSDELLALFLREALPLEPDIVTVYAGINDSRTGTARGGTGDVGEAGGVRFTLRRISLLRVPYRALRERMLFLAVLDTALFPMRAPLVSADAFHRHLDGKVDAFFENLSQLQEECVRRGIRLIVGTQQAKSLSIARSAIKGISYREEVGRVAERLSSRGHLTPNETYFLTHSRLMDAMVGWAAPAGVPVVDVIAALDAERDQLVSWVHLSPRGNQLVAAAFAEEILRREPESRP